MFLVWSCSSFAQSMEARCLMENEDVVGANKCSSNYIWVIIKSIAYKALTYIRGWMVILCGYILSSICGKLFRKLQSFVCSKWNCIIPCLHKITIKSWLINSKIQHLKWQVKYHNHLIKSILSISTKVKILCWSCIQRVLTFNYNIDFPSLNKKS